MLASLHGTASSPRTVASELRLRRLAVVLCPFLYGGTVATQGHVGFRLYRSVAFCSCVLSACLVPFLCVGEPESRSGQAVPRRRLASFPRRELVQPRGRLSGPAGGHFSGISLWAFLSSYPKADAQGMCRSLLTDTHSHPVLCTGRGGEGVDGETPSYPRALHMTRN